MLLLAAGCRPDAAPDAWRPAGLEAANLLLVTLDTTRADRLGSYGGAAGATPALDALAAGGVRVADAVTPVPLTLPAHATILTGLDPSRHGVRDNGEFRLAADTLTLAESLAAAGYETAAFVSSFVLDARFGLAQGFEHYDDRVAAARGPVFGSSVSERPADQVTRAALAWLERRSEPRRPFFLWIHYYDPHLPYEPPEPFARRFAGDPYLGEIAFVDREVGELLAALERPGFAATTLRVVVADHGEGLGDHGELGHGTFVYDSTVRVPLLLSCPGRIRPRALDGFVASSADVVPTVLDLLGLADGRERDGRSLVGDPPGEDRAVALETLVPFLDHGWSPLHGLRRHGDKLVVAPRSEYYDLREDPEELRNLFTTARGASASARDELRKRIEERLASEPTLAEIASARTPLDEEEVRRLESLGYLTGGPVGHDGALADPKDGIPFLRALDRATALLHAGRRREAIALLERGRSIAPADLRVLELLTRAHLELGEIEQGEETLRVSIARRPTADHCLLLAQILIRRGELAEAELWLVGAAALEPEHGGVEIARGDLLAGRGDTDGARAAYQNAARIDPYRAAGLAAARLQALESRAGTR